VTPFAKTVTTRTPVEVRPAVEGKNGALVAEYADGTRALLKPRRERSPSGQLRQRGLPVSSAPQREVAFYRLAKLVGYEALVPETVLTEKAVDGVLCSAQAYVTAYHLKRLCPRLKDTQDEKWGAWLARASLTVPKKFWRQLLLLDIVAGSRDRHANNVGVTATLAGERMIYRLVAWDNAASFGLTFDRYHNVFHKFIFRKSVDWDAVWPVADAVTIEGMNDALGGLISDEEIAHAFLRLQFFRDYPYKLPWLVCSDGNDGPNDFPARERWFTPGSDLLASAAA
jgi:hypothetical protein